MEGSHMTQFLPMMFSLLVSGSVAAAFICILVCGALDSLSRLSHFRAARQSQAMERRNAQA
jgi:hypothetical protein